MMQLARMWWPTPSTGWGGWHENCIFITLVRNIDLGRACAQRPEAKTLGFSPCWGPIRGDESSGTRTRESRAVNLTTEKRKRDLMADKNSEQGAHTIKFLMSFDPLTREQSTWVMEKWPALNGQTRVELAWFAGWVLRLCQVAIAPGLWTNRF